jgi:hypothetical protein
MRRIAILAVLGAMLAGSSGCALNIWNHDPNRRARELLTVSEDLRTIYDEWERIWFVDQPSHLTPYRVHGGIQ